MKPSLDDWSVELKTFGREGYFFYHEGSRELPFYWELGGGDVVAIVRIDEPDKFGVKYPWAVERKREIFDRVARELIRQSPDCAAEIDDQKFCIYVRRAAA